MNWVNLNWHICQKSFFRHQASHIFIAYICFCSTGKTNISCFSAANSLANITPSPSVSLAVSAVAMFHQQCWHRAEVWIPATALHQNQRDHLGKRFCVTLSTRPRIRNGTKSISGLQHIRGPNMYHRSVPCWEEHDKILIDSHTCMLRPLPDEG